MPLRARAVESQSNAIVEHFLMLRRIRDLGSGVLTGWVAINDEQLFHVFGAERKDFDPAGADHDGWAWLRWPAHGVDDL